MKKALAISLILISIIIAIVVWQIGHTNKNFSAHGTLAVICSHPDISASELFFYTKKGAKLEELELGEKGVFKIEQTKQNKLVLPASRSSKIIHVNLDDFQVKKERTYSLPTFYKQVKNKSLLIARGDNKKDRLGYSTYELRKNNKQNKVKSMEGVVWCVTTYNEKAYVYYHLLPQKRDDPKHKYMLRVIDFNNLKVENEVILGKGSARNIKIISNNILIPRVKKELVKIPLNNLQSITKEKLNFPYPNSIHEYQDKIYILHTSGKISILDKTSLKTINTFDLKRKKLYLVASELHNGKLYTLIKTKEGRKILIVNLDQLSIEKTIDIKSRGNLLAQNIKFIE